METTQTSTIVSGETRSGWRKTDTMWMLGLYGTAIGAGVLFLPINAGVDRQEQDARANRCTVQAQHPHGVGFTPSAAGFARNDGAGLSGFHLYLLEESTKSNE